VQRKGVNEASESWVITDKKTGKYVSRSALSKPLSPFVDDVKSAKTFDAYFDALTVMDELKAKNPKLSLIAQKNQLSESTQIVVKALMQKFKISESKAKSIVAKVSASLL